MRTVFYAVINTNTKERVTVGVNRLKAEAKLAELQKENLEGNFKIIYKWGNI